MKFKRLLVLLFAMIALAVPGFLYAQDITVKGKVVDSKTNQPLSRATVKVKNTNTSTVTDDNGQFTIKAPSAESVITITYVGYAVYEAKAGSGNITASMTDLGTDLNEVVVVGYGTQRLKDVTGSMVSVDAKKLEDMPVRTVSEALRGQVPGLNVSGGNARPGINPIISIRQQFGFGKDNFSALPLIVIDDVIQVDPSTGRPSTDQFNLLDPTEIESITVLRDASAAIYGSRAAQGAIVVKTKRGKTGPPKITYSGKFEVNDAISHVKTMNAWEHGIFANRFGRASGWTATQFFDSTELEKMKSLDYNWLDEAWKAAGAMQHSLNVSGGSDRATYFAGGSYFTQNANLGAQDYNRWTFRTGTDVKVVNNVKLSATIAANNFDLEKSFTKVSLNDGGYTKGAEQTDYAVLAHMPRYIPWQYEINGVKQWVSPALGPNRAGTTPVGQNNITGWNYFGLLNNGSKTTTDNFSYNTQFTLQYDVPFVKGLSVKGSYGLIYSADNTEQNMLPLTLSIATNAGNQTGKHLYDPVNTTWVTGENKQGSRIVYIDAIGKVKQANLYVNYDNSFGKHNVSAVGSIERGTQYYERKFVIYDQPLAGYNGAYTSAGTLNTSNTTVIPNEVGSLSYLGRVNYNYDSKYLLQFLFRSDASTVFAPENYWGFFPSVSAGWVISREKWFSDLVPWVDNLKLRASVGKAGNNNIPLWRWLQLYGYAADKGFAFGSSGGALSGGLLPEPTPNRDAHWDKAIKQNYGIDASLLRGRLSFSVDRYLDHITDMLTTVSGSTGVPISVGGAVAERNFSAITVWGTEISATWRDKIGRDFDYSIGLNFGTGDNRVEKYVDVPFNYPSTIDRQVGYSTIRPKYGFKVWTGTSTGDGILRTNEDIDAYWAYLTDLATKANTTPSYLGITSKSGVKRGMLAYQDLAGQLDATNRTIPGANGRVEKDQDYAQLIKKNRGLGFNTNLSANWKGISLNAQIATSWGGYTGLDYIKQGTSTGQLLWSHESYLNDMYDTLDNVKGAWPNLAYFDQNSAPSDFWQVSSFRSYVRSLTVGYTLPKGISSKMRMQSLRISFSGYNLWDFYNPYPDKYRNMYDDPATDYPTLRTWAVGINATF